MWRDRLRQRPVAATLIAAVIVGVALALPFVPGSVSILRLKVEANRFSDLTENAGFETAGGWEIERYGPSTADFVTAQVGEGNRSLFLRGEGTAGSNVTVRYNGTSGPVLYRIDENLVIRFMTRFQGGIDPASKSFLAITAAVFWNNLTLIRLTIAVGNFEAEDEGVRDTGLTFVRKFSSVTGWDNYVFQLAKVKKLAVEWLVKYGQAPQATLQDDFRFWPGSLAALPINAELWLDSFALSQVRPARVLLTLYGNSLLPMSALLSSVAVNGSAANYQVNASGLPFTNFEVETEILRPLISGEAHVIRIEFQTGVYVQERYAVTTAPRWL